MIPFPESTGNRIKLSRSGYIKAGVGVFIILAAIVSYVFEFRQFNLLLDTGKFLLVSLIIGAIIGISIGKRFADKEWELFEQVRLYVICVVLTVVFMPLLVSLLNRHLDFNSPDVQSAELVSVQAQFGEPFGYVKGEEVKVNHYKTVVLIQDQLINLKTKENPFPQHQAGDQVEIPIRNGLLGIRYLGL